MAWGRSAWAVRSWGGGLTTPTSAGTITATAVTATGRVTIQVNWTGALFVDVYRVYNGQLTPVRGAYPIASTGSVTFSDPEAPLDVAVYYVASSPNFPGQQITSTAVTLVSNGSTWLTHPTKPTAATKLHIERSMPKARGIDQAVFRVLNRKNAVAVTGGVRYAPSFTLPAFTDTEAERLNMLDLLDDGSPLLLRTPDGYGFDPLTWIAVGSIEETPYLNYGGEPARHWPLPCEQVDAPSLIDAPVVV